MRYNIGRLICVSFSIVLLLVALISGFSVAKLNDIVDTLHDIVNNNMATAHDMRRIRSQHMEETLMFEKGLRYAEEFSVLGVHH